MAEKWKQTLNGFYEVSSCGRVKNTQTGRIRKLYKSLSGHVTFNGGKKFGTQLVSRLVCGAFHGKPTKKRWQAAHWDGDASNNHKDNLRWVSQSENEDDKHRHGTWHLRVSGAKLTKTQVKDIREILSGLEKTKCGQFPRGSLKKLADQYDVTNSNISAIGHNISWQGVI